MKIFKSLINSLTASLLIVLFLSPYQLQAQQSFNDGVDLYQQGKYEEAVSVFTKINTDQGKLFSGKAYFGLGKYLTAKAYLSQVSESSKDLFLESQYTLALADFQLGLYGDALNRLYRLKQQDRKTQVVVDGNQLYEDILDYLTINQRKSAFQQSEYPEIKYDIVASAFGVVEYPVAKTLYQQLKNAKIDTTSAAIQKLSRMISDSLSYAVQIAYDDRFPAPNGITYNIGVALPTYPANASGFEVSRGLHFGYVMATEQFNQQHPAKKAFIRYKNTGTLMDSTDFAMTDFAWDSNVDAVLGPLFSEPAQRMAKLAEQYQIPLIAPLSNSDTLNIDNPYVYQANPTFASHGRKMAEFAVQKLKMDTLAVLTEKNKEGEASAFAFRKEAEQRGAKVSYFFVEDLESKGYELTDYTKYFTTDSTTIDSLGYHRLDGIYAPFTSQAAATLVELLLVDLEAMNSDLTVMGSQAWGNVKIPENQRVSREIYFSESYYRDARSQQVEQFIEEYKRRFNIEPNRFSMIGHDVASYVLNTLNRIGNPELLKNALKNQPLFEGLISNISFEGTHINQEVKIFEITDQGIRPTLE